MVVLFKFERKGAKKDNPFELVSNSISNNTNVFVRKKNTNVICTHN